jgi:hypothetical protein
MIIAAQARLTANRFLMRLLFIPYPSPTSPGGKTFLPAPIISQHGFRKQPRQRLDTEHANVDAEQDK